MAGAKVKMGYGMSAVRRTTKKYAKAAIKSTIAFAMNQYGEDVVTDEGQSFAEPSTDSTADDSKQNEPQKQKKLRAVTQFYHGSISQ